ncbi:MAG: hypothetical protein EBR82_45285 [Caulobacteraceae bacterium]|nr:hypothetical protein [Caulobacteraceae bacterium]
MDVVQRFKAGIAWYQPTTDTDSWKYFYETIYSLDYSTATPATLKKAAWLAKKLQTTVDVGMWADRASRLQKFLAADIALEGATTAELDALQYDFVACFLNYSSQASHNEDLWKSINDSATKVLNENIEPDLPAMLAAPDLPNINYRWLLTGIPLILVAAIKSVNLSYYRPTTDTDTWSYFQDVMFNLTAIPNVGFTYQHTYLLSNITGPVDAGMWGPLAGAASAFLDANLGAPPANATAQVKLAIDFCNIIQFNYQHAAHNADLFKAYNDAFATAKQKLQLLIPGTANI